MNPVLFGDPRLPTRFWEKVYEDESSCWIWLASKSPDGYGHFNVGGRCVHPHRLVAETFIRVPADGEECDHLCRETSCVNPYHLEVVTRWENTLRGFNFAAINAKKTHCSRGHAFDDKNTYRDKVYGRRKCRACHAIQERNRQRQMRAAS